MARGTKPLKRTEMKRAAPVERRGYNSAALTRAKPISKVGRKRKREREAEEACRKAVIARSARMCEAPDGYCDRPVPHHGVAMHHRAPSDRDRGVHDPARCAWLCDAAHRRAHANPAESYRLGLLLRFGPEHGVRSTP